MKSTLPNRTDESFRRTRTRTRSGAVGRMERERTSLGKLSNVSALDYVRKSGDNWNPPNCQNPSRALYYISFLTEMRSRKYPRIAFITSLAQLSAELPWISLIVAECSRLSWHSRSALHPFGSCGSVR